MANALFLPSQLQSRSLSPTPERLVGKTTTWDLEITVTLDLQAQALAAPTTMATWATLETLEARALPGPAAEVDQLPLQAAALPPALAQPPLPETLLPSAAALTHLTTASVFACALRDSTSKMESALLENPARLTP